MEGRAGHMSQNGLIKFVVLLFFTSNIKSTENTR